MKNRKLCLCFPALVTVTGLLVLPGCDSGEQALNEVTGNRPVMQYRQSKQDVGKIADQQAERHKSAAEGEGEEGRKE